MSQMDAKAEETWQWSKAEGVWLVFNGKSEGFIANSERSAIVACHYLNALQQQLADLQAERELLGEKELYAIWHAAASNTFEAFSAEWRKLNARKRQDALISPSPIAPEEAQR